MRSNPSKMFRAIVVGGASLVGTATLGVICDACGSGETAGPICQTSLLLGSPCGIKSMTTDCPAPTMSCDPKPMAACTVGPVTADCSVTVVLGDGTSHTFPVTVDEKQGCIGKVIVSPEPSFYSSTCQPPAPTFDASPDANDASDAMPLDAADDAIDASEDALDGD